ncbi:unnamed protein product, partial [Nippostrongylus brasiliensis]|uniref:Uncharacterized protein n=1 Tax=Nippostrongylus brasiliensis TaxID=27835 RepID=A0A0N4XQ50_NIPBR
MDIIVTAAQSRTSAGGKENGLQLGCMKRRIVWSLSSYAHDSASRRAIVVAVVVVAAAAVAAVAADSVVYAVTQ